MSDSDDYDLSNYEEEKDESDEDDEDDEYGPSAQKLLEEAYDLPHGQTPGSQWRGHKRTHSSTPSSLQRLQNPRLMEPSTSSEYMSAEQQFNERLYRSKEPREGQLEEVHWRMGEPGWSKTIEEDIAVLRERGLYIDYSANGKLGRGSQGMVFRGTYAIDLPAREAHHHNIAMGEPFAVKLIDHKTCPNHPIAPPQKELTENEKFIVTNVNHPNVVTVKFVINMGEQKLESFENSPSNAYICSDRVYIFMELADAGCLETWIARNGRSMDPWIRIRLIRDLFRGLMYLHSQDIIHGDAVSKNVLLFNRGGRLTAKWSDFGCGFVGENGQRYLYKKPISRGEWEEKAEEDIFNMSQVFEEIFKGRSEEIQETQWERTILNGLSQLIAIIQARRPSNIVELFEQYRDLLEGEPPMIEEDVC